MIYRTYFHGIFRAFSVFKSHERYLGLIKKKGIIFTYTNEPRTNEMSVNKHRRLGQISENALEKQVDELLQPNHCCYYSQLIL